MSTRLRKNNGTFIDADNVGGSSVKIYRASILFGNADDIAPTENYVLQNDFTGLVTWSFVATGQGNLNIPGAFTNNKVFINATIQDRIGRSINATRVDSDNIFFEVFLTSTMALSNLGGSVYVEILVYS